jgi:hypothetical protein
MHVEEAAKLLGVGRPPLSNLLNGNAAASPEMAARIEKAFGADQQKASSCRRSSISISISSTQSPRSLLSALKCLRF